MGAKPTGLLRKALVENTSKDCYSLGLLTVRKNIGQINGGK
jgi:hypothetical protein